MFSHFKSTAHWLGLLALAMLLIPATFAQDASARTLQPGLALSGTLDADNIAQVYTFEGRNGQIVSLTANVVGEDAAQVGLALLVTDALGEPVAQAVDSESSGTVALDDLQLPRDGVFYVTVMRQVSDDEVSETSFELTLEEAQSTAETTPSAAGEVLTTNGLEVRLTWSATANLDLEVRDPVGGSLYWDNPLVESGGTMGINTNGVCALVTADSPFEEAVWPGGAIPTGSYEILVYYQVLEDCPTSNPVPFTVDVVVDGEALTPIQGTLTPNGIFVSRFEVNAEGAAEAGPSGLYNEVTISPTLRADVGQVENAPTLTTGTSVTGTITNEQPFAAYSFVATANDVVTVALDATSGSLDPLIFLLDPNGNVVDLNDDDPVSETTNAAIRNRTLVTAGNYTIVATRYGQEIGGTEGDFTLTFGGQTGGLPPEIAAGLPDGVMEVSLLWNSNADLQLLVRDPRGDAVFDDIPVIPSGGRLGVAGNVNCRQAQASPLSYIYWPAGGRLPAGSYEVEVWYQNQCNDTTPVSFTLNIVINEQLVFSDQAQPLPPEPGNLERPGDRYLVSFTVDVDGQVTVGQGGIIGGIETLDFQGQVASARVLTDGERVSGTISDSDKFDVYSFDGETGDLVTVNMEATSGTLDPTLFLVSADGATQLAFNDDVEAGEATNSLISEFPLPADGRYIIIATHYGGAYGGTVGSYDLTFTLLT